MKSKIVHQIKNEMKCKLIKKYLFNNLDKT